MGLSLNSPHDADEPEKVSMTTPDGKFTIRTVACFGQCALAPVVEVDHRIRGHVNERTLQRDLKSLEGERD
jgi:NADH-quinone oxidoreductase subunit E